VTTKSIIISEISAKVGPSRHSIWTIGLTHNLAERKMYWFDRVPIDRWCAWTADSISAAQDIEFHFLSKGMQGGRGGKLSTQKTVYVYIF
jgi:hypothetical protein